MLGTLEVVLIVHDQPRLKSPTHDHHIQSERR